MFAQAREAAGRSRVDSEEATVGAVLDALTERFGPGFAAVVDVSTIWCNGEPAEPADVVGPRDELAIVPPVSGG